MESKVFTPEALMEDLLKKFAHLNDGGAKAREMYEKIKKAVKK